MGKFTSYQHCFGQRGDPSVMRYWDPEETKVSCGRTNDLTKEMSEKGTKAQTGPWWRKPLIPAFWGHGADRAL